MLEICDAVYGIQIDRLWAKSLTNMQVAATLLAAGVNADELPMQSFEEMQAEFDARLVAEPEPENPTEQVFRALGLVA